MRRTTLAILGTLLAAALFEAMPAQAQNYPWCAQRSDGSRYCGYASYEQCVANAARGSCERNYQYEPPAGSAQPGRRSRGR
jgi:hypothetical protein